MVALAFRSFAIALCVLYSFTALDRTPAHAQADRWDGIYMTGRIDNDDRKSGIYGRNNGNIQRPEWLVFVGANGSVYKLTLSERNITNLVIDGQKVDDDKIWKHTAEFKAQLERRWRDRDIESESSALEKDIKPVDKQMESVQKALEKIDAAEEKLERSSSGFTQRQSLNEQRKRLLEIERDLDLRMENLSKLQEKLSNEQERLNVVADIDRVLDQIANDLISIGVIRNKSNLTFKLSNTELIVNGTRISSDAHEMLKAKYIVEQNGEVGFVFRWKGKL